MKLYTKNGDFGETTALNGETLSKNDVLMHFEGTVDELNAHLGLIKTKLSGGDKGFVEGIQLSLMKVMAHGSAPDNDKYIISGGEITALEGEIDRLSELMPKEFKMVIPGKSETEACIHIARTVARRAERLLVALCARRPLHPNAGIYLNRLSDYLFALGSVI